MTLEEAKSYINFGIKEGYYDPDKFEGWSDEEIIKFAEEEGARGDTYANDPEEVSEKTG